MPRALRDSFTIAESLDVFDARRGVRALATAHGFDPKACDELALVVSELATNILKHGVRGVIRMEHVADERGARIRIMAEDQGPQIPDLDFALRDGHTAGRRLAPEELPGRLGIGAGLGAIRRLSDELLYERGEGGNRFIVTRFRKRPIRRF